MHYATGQEGIVEIESEWTARKREMKNPAGEEYCFPPFAKNVKDGHPHSRGELRMDHLPKPEVTQSLGSRRFGIGRIADHTGTRNDKPDMVWPIS